MQKDKKCDNFSQYDCELFPDENLNNQESSYYNTKHFYQYISDNDIEIPNGFDPYQVTINLEGNSIQKKLKLSKKR